MNVRSVTLQAEQYDRLSLYIHIPFCRKKCDYCDFYSLTGTGTPERQVYIERILSEISEMNRRYPKAYETLFIGGGDPGMIGAEGILRIIERAEEHGKISEISVEMNPRHVTAKMLDRICPQVDRLSIGIQSLKLENLQQLGRASTPEGSVRALRTAADYTATCSISVDLMQGIPQQGYDDTIRDIDTILGMLDIDHISVYDLIVEDGTPLKQRISQKQELDRNNNLLSSCADVTDYLRDLGFARYEVSNYARKDHICLHNMHYWEMLPYLGIGCSAVSTLYTGTGPVRMTCSREFTDYVYEKEPLSDRMYHIEALSDIEFLEELLIMGLRTERGVSLPRIRRMFGLDLKELLERTIERYTDGEQLLTIKEESLRVTGRGWEMMNSILVDMLIDIDSGERLKTTVLDTYF